MTQFSKVIKAGRKGLKLTQSQMARLVGMSKSSVNMWERGEREPNLDTLCRIADVLNLSLDELLGRRLK